MRPVYQKRLAVILAGIMAIMAAATVVFFASIELMKTDDPAPQEAPTPPTMETLPTEPGPAESATQSPSDYVFTGQGPGEHITKMGSLMTEEGIEVRAHNLRMEYTVGSAAVCVDLRIANYRSTPVPYTNTDWRIQRPNGQEMPLSYQRTEAILGSGTIPPDHGVSGVICRMGDLSDEGEYIVTYSPDIAVTLEGSGEGNVSVNPADMTFFGWTQEGR